MIYYEAAYAVMFNENTHQSQINEIINNSINFAMLNDTNLRETHKINTYKLYSFCSPYPLEADKTYKNDKLYMFNIRSLDLNFIKKMKILIPNTSKSFKVFASEIHNRKYKYINTLTTLTPVVSTLDKRYWTKEDGLELLMQRIHSNAVKKAKAYFGEGFEEPNENFIQCISLQNIKTIKIPYKNTSLIGNKVEIEVKADEVSQKLAWIIMATGMLEKNSLGCGFCRAK